MRELERQLAALAEELVWPDTPPLRAPADRRRGRTAAFRRVSVILAATLLLAERLPADKALHWGLINQVHDDDKLLDAACALGDQLSARPTRTLALTRRACWASLDNSFDVGQGLTLFNFLDQRLPLAGVLRLHQVDHMDIRLDHGRRRQFGDDVLPHRNSSLRWAVSSMMCGRSTLATI